MAEAGGLDAGELVREATRRAGRGAGGGAGGLDLALGLQVCEVVAGAGAGAAGAAVAALQRALKGRSPLPVRLALALTDLLLRECGAGFLQRLPAQAFFNTYMNMVNNIRFTHAAHDEEEWLEVLEVALQYPGEWAARAAPLGSEFPVFQALAGHLASQKDLVALRAQPPPALPGGGVHGRGGAEVGARAGARQLLAVSRQKWLLPLGWRVTCPPWSWMPSGRSARASSTRSR